MGSLRLTWLEVTNAQLVHYLKKNGSHQANCQEVHWRESSSEAARYQGRSEVCPCYRWSEEAAQVQAWHRGSQGNKEISEVNGVAHPQTAVPALSQGDCPGFQDGSQVPKFRCDGSAGGKRGLPGGIVRGH